MPDKYNTDYFKFFRLAFVGLLAYLMSTLLAPIVSVSPYVLCLIVRNYCSKRWILGTSSVTKSERFRISNDGTYAIHFRWIESATPSMMVEITLSTCRLYHFRRYRHVHLLVFHRESAESQ